MSMTRIRYVHTELTGEHFVLISPLIHLVLWKRYIHTCTCIHVHVCMYNIYWNIFIRFFSIIWARARLMGR